MLPLLGLAKSMEPWKSNYEGLVKGDTCGYKHILPWHQPIQIHPLAMDLAVVKLRQYS
jgi:hypothetical protein